MANMREIRNRMKSIQGTMKITKAMYVVSSSKLKKAQKQYDRTKPYYKALSNTMADIMEHIEPEVTHKYINDKPPVDESKVNRLFIVVTADKGLAGAYNHNVIKLTEQWLAKGNNNTLFVVGQMGKHYFEKKGVLVDIEFTQTVQNPNPHRARDIAERVIELYDKGYIDEVYMIFSKTKNGSCEADVSKILPLERKKFEKVENKEEYNQFAIFSPSPKAVLKNLVPNYVKGLIYSALVSSYTSEHNARMVAMKSATDSATDMLKSLELLYNRARQAAITQEINEIVGGASALQAD